MPLTMPVLDKLPRRESNAVPRSQVERLWLIGGGLVAVVLILIGYFFFIGPQRSKTSDVNSQAASTRLQNSVLQARISQLRQQNVNLPKYQADLAKARLALPSASGVPDFVRSMQTLGNATLTDVTNVTIGQPAPILAAAATTPTGTTTPSPVTTAAPAAPSAYSLSISATVSGSPSALDNFLEQLQAVQPRAVLISQITESSNPSGTGNATTQTTLQLTMNAFIAPSAAAAGAPTPGASPSSAPN